MQRKGFGNSPLTDEEVLDDLRQENSFLKAELVKLCQNMTHSHDSISNDCGNRSSCDGHLKQILSLQAVVTEEKRRFESLRSRTLVVESELERSEKKVLQLQDTIQYIGPISNELLETKTQLELSEKENLLLLSTIDSLASKIKLLETITNENARVIERNQVTIKNISEDYSNICKERKELHLELDTVKFEKGTIQIEKEQLQFALEKAELSLATVRSEVMNLERKCESQSKEITRLHANGNSFIPKVMERKVQIINKRSSPIMEETSCTMWGWK